MTKYIKRIGSSKIRFDFEIFLNTIEIPQNTHFSGILKISIKKGKRMAQTKIPHKVDSSISHNPLNETLIFPATLYMMKKSLKYLQKPVSN